MKLERLAWLLLAVSVVINVALAHRLRLFNQLIDTESQPSLEAGAAVPPIDAVDLNGETQNVRYDLVSKPTVLYVFTPTCPWCARNLDNLNTLIDKKNDEYRIIGLSLSKDALSEYVGAHHLTIPIYTGLTAATLKAYKLGATPETIVISSEGRVIQSWVGAYGGAQKSQIEGFFHVALPGVRAQAASEPQKSGSKLN